ncbi:MAG: CPBP family intramembrane metalloprotease [Bacteroidales bacterium]|jgi:membrane protease YdiL (CAAX protease family)|nr:CPBP family intramembrane metalloprotease [Bacteroidales bacterium]
MINKTDYFLPDLKECWIIVFLLIVIGGVGIGFCLQLLAMVSDTKITDMNVLFTYVLPLLPALFYIFHKGRKAFSEGKSSGCPIDDPHYGRLKIVPLALLLIIGCETLSLVCEPLGSIFEMPDQFKELFSKISGDGFWSFLSIVIAAPVLEEFLLRGIIERGLLKYKTPAAAIIWSAFFFALIHMNPWQSIVAFFFGLFLGWIYWRTHSLLATIFIHAVNNGTSFMIMLLFPDLPVDFDFHKLIASIWGTDTYYAVYATSLLLFLISVFLLHKYLSKSGFDKKRITGNI